MSSVQLGTLLHLAEAALAGEFVFLGRHFDVVLGVTKCAVFGEERTVTSVQDVQIRITQVGVLVNVEGAVPMADVLRHDGSSVGRIFAVQNKGRPGLGAGKELRSQVLLVVVVHRAVDVSSLILVLKAAIDNQNVVELFVEFPIHELQENGFVDTGQRVSLVLMDDMREVEARGSFDVANRLKWCICSKVGLFFDNNILWMLKHTQRTPALFTRAHQRVGTLPNGRSRGRSISTNMAATVTAHQGRSQPVVEQTTRRVVPQQGAFPLGGFSEHVLQRSRRAQRRLAAFALEPKGRCLTFRGGLRHAKLKRLGFAFGEAGPQERRTPSPIDQPRD